MIRAILFDFDETLVSVREANYRAYLESLSAYQVENENSEKIFNQVWHREISDLDAMRQMVNNEELILKVQSSFSDYYEKYHLEYIKVFPGIISILEVLHSKEIKLGIVSLKSRRKGEKELAACELGKFFNIVIWGNDLDKPKPSIEACNYVLEKLQVRPSETLICGDGPDDIKMGKNATIKTIGALWGDTNRELLIRSEPTYLCYKPQEVLDIICNQN